MSLMSELGATKHTDDFIRVTTLEELKTAGMVVVVALAVHCSSYTMAVRSLRSTTVARTWAFHCIVDRSKTAS
jgi:hypothetical protein